MSNIYNDQEPHEPLDIIVLGAYNVGKTTLIQKFCQQATPQHLFHTIGIEFAAKSFVHRNKTFRIKFWDTCTLRFKKAGDPKYHNLAIEYLSKASAVLLVYDLTSYSSFHQANEWINLLYQMQKDLPILLYGNKHDLLFKGTIMNNQKRQVSEKDGITLAQKVDAIWIEGCGKTDNNFQLALKLLIQKFFVDDVVVETTQVKSSCFCC